MVCLYGITLDKIPEYVRITRKLTLEESGFADWNWLIHLLTEHMYNLNISNLQAEGYYGQPEFPYVAHPNDQTPWGLWFARVKAGLGKHFDDADAQRVFKCCKEPPNEEVAMIIYDACTLEEQRAFQGSLLLPSPYDIVEEEEFQMENNPADPIHSLPPPAPTFLPPPAPTFLPPPASTFLPPPASTFLPPPASTFIFPQPMQQPMQTFNPAPCQCEHCIADAAKNISVNIPSPAIINLNTILASSGAY